MMIAKAQWNDESEIVCYHGFQSFKAGEVTPEQAHKVGVKLAKKMWGDRFQVIVATHLNTECLYNHFVVNSVSFTDGKHYHDNKKNLWLLRRRWTKPSAKSYMLKDFDRQMTEMGYRINFAPNRKYWTIVCKGYILQRCGFQLNDVKFLAIGYIISCYKKHKHWIRLLQ